MKVALHNRRQEFSVNQGGAVTNEFMNADVMMNELMNALQFLRQNFPVTVVRHIKAERSSGFVPCGVSRRQSRSSSREWRRLEKIERDHGLGIC